MKLVITYCTQLKLMNFIFFSKHLITVIPKKKNIHTKGKPNILHQCNQICFHLNLDYLLSE